MSQGIVVDRFPVATDEGTDKQQEGRLRLVEVGDELIDDMERITGFDHDQIGRAHV